jgi:hypothetical protein
LGIEREKKRNVSKMHKISLFFKNKTEAKKKKVQGWAQQSESQKKKKKKNGVN